MEDESRTIERQSGNPGSGPERSLSPPLPTVLERIRADAGSDPGRSCRWGLSHADLAGATTRPRRGQDAVCAELDLDR